MKKTKHVSVRLDKEEYEELHKWAEEDNMTVSQLIRFLIFGEDPLVPGS